jgi:hypothetical protein
MPVHCSSVLGQEKEQDALTGVPLFNTLDPLCDCDGGERQPSPSVRALCAVGRRAYEWAVTTSVIAVL